MSPVPVEVWSIVSSVKESEKRQLNCLVPPLGCSIRFGSEFEYGPRLRLTYSIPVD